MKYVFNKGRYALSFAIKVKGQEKKVAFDRKRIYLDTGNVATSGITEVEDDIYEILLENKRFKKLIESGEFELTEASKVEVTEKANEELKKENEELKKKLKKAEKGEDKKETEKAMKAKDDEINSLKAQLEALTKKGSADTDSDTEGF